MKHVFIEGAIGGGMRFFDGYSKAIENVPKGTIDINYFVIYRDIVYLKTNEKDGM